MGDYGPWMEGSRKIYLLTKTKHTYRSGKSSLLRCLSGLHFHEHQSVKVLGKPAFFETPRDLTFLGAEWRSNPLVKSDIAVKKLLDGVEGGDESRKQKLIEALSIVVDGRMHMLSDGQRQSVQIAAGLIKPFSLLLLDEVTVDLDVLARKNLLDFLRKETVERNATILYATHVFDGLGDWPTHILHVSNHRVRVCQELAKCAEYTELCSTWDPRMGSPLSRLVEEWLQREYDEKKRMKDEETPTTLTVEEQLNQPGSGRGDRFYNYW